LPDLARVVENAWLEVGLYPRTFAHVLLKPRALAAKLPAQLRDKTKASYTGPVLFFAANICLAACAARLTAASTQTPFLADLPSILGGAVLGNGVLLGLAVALLGRARRRDHELMLVALAYGSAYYVAISPALARVASAVSSFPEPEPAAALVVHGSWLSVLQYAALDRAPELSLTVLLSLAWILFLARMASATRSRHISVAAAWVRLAGALVLLAAFEVIVQYAIVAGPYRDMQGIGAAYARLLTSGPSADEMGAYERGETLARNIAGCPGFAPAERYLARALAAVMLVARFEAGQEMAVRLGKVRKEELRNGSRHLVDCAKQPDRLETALEKTATAFITSPSGGLVSIKRGYGLKLLDDLGDLRRLRSARGFPPSDAEFGQSASHLSLGMWLLPTGLYLCPAPQAANWPPSLVYGLHVGYDLPAPHRSAVTYVALRANPMRRMLFPDGRATE
jgi:hypothetical protein